MSRSLETEQVGTKSEGRSGPQEDGLSITHSEPDHPIRGEGEPVALTVWYGKMPESNGRENWTATLRRVNPTDKWDMGFCFARSEYPGRVLYEADRMRWIIGARKERPDILAYDADLHSGYAHPPTTYEGRRCQKCGGEIQGWTCQDCGQVFSENEAGNLVFATYEGEGLRERVALTTTPSGGGRPVTIFFNQVSSFNMTRCNDDERRVVMHGGETYRLRKSDADAILEAINANKG